MQRLSFRRLCSGIAGQSLSHIDAVTGRAAMVDISSKAAAARTAVAESTVRLGPVAYDALTRGEITKGDVLSVARVAGLMAAKRTADLVPLCHPLLLSHSAIDFYLVEERHELRIEASASCTGGTGVEMEACARRPPTPISPRSDPTRRAAQDDGRVHRGDHGLRHVQGRGEGHHHSRGALAQQERRQERAVARRGTRSRETV
jgi:cyclic pyranopterin phosphate synthase